MRCACWRMRPARVISSAAVEAFLRRSSRRGGKSEIAEAGAGQDAQRHGEEEGFEAVPAANGEETEEGDSVFHAGISAWRCCRISVTLPNQ